MKLRITILAILISASNIVYGHQDFWMVKTFGKVIVRIQTGFYYEEINKAWLIGEYTNILSKELHYNDTIFLDFKHTYTGACIPDYFIAYDDGSIKQTYIGGETNHFLKASALVIREVSRTFNIANTLNLAEYAITNLASVKLNQSNIEYNKNYCQWLIKSIDTSITRRISLKPYSAVVGRTINQKILKPKTERKQDCVISYYVKDNRYHIYFNSYETKKDTTVLILDNIYQFQEISYHEVIVFSNDSTFYYFEANYDPKSSNKLVIHDNNGYYEPYDVFQIAPDKVSISFSVYTKKEGRQPQHRTLLYRSDVGDLIQDLDKAIDK